MGARVLLLIAALGRAGALSRVQRVYVKPSAAWRSSGNGPEAGTNWAQGASKFGQLQYNVRTAELAACGAAG